jgi:hypothetical protein
MRVLAIILILVGALTLAYKGITYTKHREVIDIGPIEATIDEKKTVPFSPILGAIAVVSGFAILLKMRGERI